MVGLSRRITACACLAGVLASAGASGSEDAYEAGQARLRAGQYAEARRDFEEALRLAGSGPERAAALIGIGISRNAEKEHARARAEFEKALATEGVTLEQAAEARCRLGASYFLEGKLPEARGEMEKVLAMAGAPVEWKVQAQMTIGQSLGRLREWAEARAAFSRVPGIPGASLQQKVDARMAIVRAFFSEKAYGDARSVLAEILATRGLPPASKASARVLMGQSYLSEGNCTAAKSEFASVLALEGVPDASRAEAQLGIGLSDYRARDFDRATPELRKVLAMPGATARQTHEAKLRLCLRERRLDGEKALTVLFIGASHTQVWSIPLLVEALAASAPPGCPRIITDEFTRGGRMINWFWEEGAGPDTARAKIATEPWDFVVLETFFTLPHDGLFKYGTLFTDLIRSRGARPALYESPVNYSYPYPEKFQSFHEENVALGKALRAPVAPSCRAWMTYLGPNPPDEERRALYGRDAVHTSKKGGYMAACCIYSAITGLSPVGLTHRAPTLEPDGLSPEEAAALQKAAWTAYQETNAEHQTAFEVVNPGKE
ncbi:MAG: tetratricopeptide repeat protein [Armatimonadetes bacterium]|nr:tetratricopeptide repeat protein [Armatimonadota bacterium]